MSNRKEKSAESSATILTDLLKRNRNYLFLGCLFAVMAACLSLIQPFIVKLLLGDFEKLEEFQFSVKLLVLLAVVSVAAASAKACQRYFLTVMAELSVKNLRMRVIDHVLRLPVREFQTRNSGDIISRVSSDTAMVKQALTGGIVDAGGAIITILGAIIVMLYLDRFMVFLVLGIVIIISLTVVIATLKMQSLSRQAQQELGKIGEVLSNTLPAIRTIRASGSQYIFKARLLEATNGNFVYGRGIARIIAVLEPLVTLALHGSSVAVLVIGGARVARNDMSLAELVTFIMVLFMVIAPMGTLFNAVGSLMTARGAIGRISEILILPTEDEYLLNRRPESVEDIEKPNRNETMDKIAVEFSEVTYGYSHSQIDQSKSAKLTNSTVTDNESVVLRGVTWQALKGEYVALVGPSGAGKSTILTLIERFADPDEGVVSIFGVDVRKLSLSELRRQIAYMEQDAPILSGTLRENLLLFSPFASDAECWEALERVNLQDRFNKDGLDSIIGVQGVGLSGGQRQRLAVARILLSDAAIVLLDEPTSAMDSCNEEALQFAIDEYFRNRTRIVIAHRLSTVRNADKIIVFDSGKIIDHGKHIELLARCDLYREMVKKQSLG